MSWEDMFNENERLRAENDAAKLRVAVLERAVEEASKARHEANNRCQAVVNVCETVIKWLKRVAPGDAGMAEPMLEAALASRSGDEPVADDPVAKERARCEGWAQWYRSLNGTDTRGLIHSIRSGDPVPDKSGDG